MPAKTAHDKTVLHHEIGANDAEIDRLAYDLCGLTAEEIAVVEGEGCGPQRHEGRKVSLFLCALVVQELEVIEPQTDATDRQIGQLVYELYGPTEEEIKIVEEETK